MDLCIGWLYLIEVSAAWFSLCFHSLLQSADESVAEEVKVMLKSMLPELKKVQNSKGVEVLLEKLADVCKYKTHKNNIYHYYYFSFYSHETNQEHVYTGYISPQKSMETFSWKSSRWCYNVERNAMIIFLAQHLIYAD